MDALTRLEKIWKAKGLKLKTKIRFMNSMAKSILMYGGENWTIKENISKKMESFEMKCYRRLLGVTWKERKTNENVGGLVRENFTPEEPHESFS